MKTAVVDVAEIGEDAKDVIADVAEKRLSRMSMKTAANDVEENCCRRCRENRGYR